MKIEPHDIPSWSHDLLKEVQALEPPVWFVVLDPYTSEAADVWRDRQLEQLEARLVVAREALGVRDLADIWWNFASKSYLLLRLGETVLGNDWLNLIHPRLTDIWHMTSGLPVNERLQSLRELVESAPVVAVPLPDLVIETPC